MKGFRDRAIFLVISIMFIAGCITNQGALDQDESNNYALPSGNGITEENPGGDFGEDQFGSDAHWPDYIPAEIPELPGEIETVMVAPESHIRLFYSKVTDVQIEEYLALLVDEGFNLKFRIHVQEGFSDNSEERRQRGEYDDIDITKGEYHMTLSHWEGTATFDVYTSGFQEIAEEATAITWPEALDGVLPPPERCELVTINPGANDGHHISCQREDENVDQDYLDLLISHDFQIEQTFQNNQGEITSITMRRGEQVVNLSSISRMYFTLYTYVDPLPQWPTVFDNLVPRPIGCELTYVVPTVQDDNHSIHCQPENQNVLSDYINILEELGFVEDFKFLNAQDEITWISFHNGEIKVDISIDSPDSMGVRVAPKDP